MIEKVSMMTIYCTGSCSETHHLVPSGNNEAIRRNGLLIRARGRQFGIEGCELTSVGVGVGVFLNLSLGFVQQGSDSPRVPHVAVTLELRPDFDRLVAPKVSANVPVCDGKGGSDEASFAECEMRGPNQSSAPLSARRYKC